MEGLFSFICRLISKITALRIASRIRSINLIAEGRKVTVSPMTKILLTGALATAYAEAAFSLKYRNMMP